MNFSQSETNSLLRGGGGGEEEEELIFELLLWGGLTKKDPNYFSPKQSILIFQVSKFLYLVGTQLLFMFSGNSTEFMFSGLMSFHTKYR